MSNTPSLSASDRISMLLDDSSFVEMLEIQISTFRTRILQKTA